MAATDQDGDGSDARCGQYDVSWSPQRNQIGIVLVDCRKNEDNSGEPDEGNADTFENLHEMDGGLREEIERDNGPYQTCLADASA